MYNNTKDIVGLDCQYVDSRDVFIVLDDFTTSPPPPELFFSNNFDIFYVKNTKTDKKFFILIPKPSEEWINLSKMGYSIEVCDWVEQNNNKENKI